MNPIRTPLGLLFVAVCTAASAQEATNDAWMSASPATSTRAQVLADLQRARAEGRLAGGAAYDFTRHAPSMRSRADVQAELAAARANGEFARIGAEVARADPYGAPPRRAR